MRATAYAPGSIGNVGPGFDVLGLAVEGIGDRVTVELNEGTQLQVVVRGRDAALIPADPERNCAAIAARAYLHGQGFPGGVRVTVEKGLALAGGMGGSAASSVAAAWAAHLAVEAAVGGSAPRGAARLAAAPPMEAARDAATDVLLRVAAAALAGEAAVSGRHLDNVAPSLLGGLALARSVEPIDLVALPVAADWGLALVTPSVRIETRQARAVLPPRSETAVWVQEMANTAALVHAFATGDGALLGRALDDRFAEPVRAPAIPGFAMVKRAALDAGGFGGSISGAGPTVFAIARDVGAARRCAVAMRAAFAEVGIESVSHVGGIERQGVRRR
jgi:homoserine kinase